MLEENSNQIITAVDTARTQDENDQLGFENTGTIQTDPAPIDFDPEQFLNKHMPYKKVKSSYSKTEVCSLLRLCNNLVKL